MASSPTGPSPPMANGTMASGLPSVIHRIMRRLESGLVLKRFYSKRRPEKRMYQVKLETRQLVWQRPTNNRPQGCGKSFPNLHWHCCVGMMFVLLFAFCSHVGLKFCAPLYPLYEYLVCRINIIIMGSPKIIVLMAHNKLCPHVTIVTTV